MQARRLWSLIFCRSVLLSALLSLSGCAFFGGMRVPAADRQPQDVQRRLDPQTRKAAMAALFPESGALHMTKGRIDLKGVKLVGETRLSVSLFAQGESQWRLFASSGEKQLLDAIDRDGYLTAILYMSGNLYQGPAPAKGSVFAQGMGWDPADLLRALSIGSKVAAGDFKQDQDATGPIWRPMTPEAATTGTLALEWVRLDPKSGLPSAAHWSQDGRSVGATYSAWDRFASVPLDSDAPATTSAVVRLMPSKIELKEEQSGATLSLEAEKFSFEENPNVARIYSPIVNVVLRQKPVSALAEALK